MFYGFISYLRKKNICGRRSGADEGEPLLPKKEETEEEIYENRNNIEWLEQKMKDFNEKAVVFPVLSQFVIVCLYQGIVIYELNWYMCSYLPHLKIN